MSKSEREGVRTWEVRDGITRLFVVDGEKTLFDICFEHYDTEEEVKNIAHHIVHCVNNFERLVTALRYYANERNWRGHSVCVTGPELAQNTLALLDKHGGSEQA